MLEKGELSDKQLCRLLSASLECADDIYAHGPTRAYIMEHGKFVESGPAEEVILHPTAAYTKRLISDVPKIYEPWDLTTV